MAESLMPWWEFAEVGDRVISIPTGIHGTLVSITAQLNGRIEFTASLDNADPGGLTLLAAPPDHFIPEEDVPVHDPEALERWLES